MPADIKTPAINFDSAKVTAREAQIIVALFATHVSLHAQDLLARGNDAADPKLQREASARALEFMRTMFPDLNFRMD
jgi:hypothetical protein